MLNINGQTGIQALIMRPTGNFGAIMKPCYTLELSKAEFFTEDKTRFYWSANVGWFRPRLDEFRTYTVVTSGTSIVYPGTEQFDTYLTLNGNGGFDYTPIEDGKFFPYAGVDLTVGAYRYRSLRQVEGISNTDESILGVLIGGRVKLGLEYQFSSETAFFIQYSPTVWLNIDPLFLATRWDLGIGIRKEF